MAKASNDTATPKYPQVRVKLDGEDGNSFAILARCAKAARKAKVAPKEIEAFCAEAISGDYDHLLRTCMRWFSIP